MRAIPNPKKSFQIEASLESIKWSIKDIYLFTSKYKKYKENDMLNIVTYQSFELLSLGVYVDITMASISETKTEVTIEIRRKIGSFNQSHEVSLANKHIETISELIGESLSLGADERNAKRTEIELKRLQEENYKREEIDRNPSIYMFKKVLGAIITIGAIILWIHLFTK